MWLEVTSLCNMSTYKPALQQSAHLIMPHQPLHRGLWMQEHGCCVLQLSKGPIAGREQEASWEDSSTPWCPKGQAALSEIEMLFSLPLGQI